MLDVFFSFILLMITVYVIMAFMILIGGELLAFLGILAISILSVVVWLAILWLISEEGLIANLIKWLSIIKRVLVSGKQRAMTFFNYMMRAR